jgi:dolichol-phosphate mannosyltransferase
VDWEIIFVDDSPDGTSERIREISRRDRRVRCLQWIGRRASRRPASKGPWQLPAPCIAGMDADMQHDKKLRRGSRFSKSEPVDLVPSAAARSIFASVIAAILAQSVSSIISDS